MCTANYCISHLFKTWRKSIFQHLINLLFISIDNEQYYLIFDIFDPHIDRGIF